MGPTKNDLGLCLLRLCSFEITRKQSERLQSFGLVDNYGALTPAGFVRAYTAMADVLYGGSSNGRAVIADAARKEAVTWQELDARNKAHASSKGGG